MAPISEGGVGPWIIPSKFVNAARDAITGLDQSRANPLCYGDRNSIPDKSPTGTMTRVVICRRRGPAARQSLKRLRVLDGWRHHGVVRGEPNGWGGWDSDRRSCLQGRHAVDRPPQASVPFRPIEPSGTIVFDAARQRGDGIITKKDQLRIRLKRRDQDDSLASLWQSKCSSIDNAVCPSKAHAFEQSCHMRHCFAAI